MPARADIEEKAQGFQRALFRKFDVFTGPDLALTPN
jgi:hypothetical protein